MSNALAQAALRGPRPQAVFKMSPTSSQVHVLALMGTAGAKPPRKVKDKGVTPAKRFKSKPPPKGSARVLVQKRATVKAPIIDTEADSQTVMCVVLEPDTVDIHNDVMHAADIQYTAHKYLVDSRIVKSEHLGPIGAEIVESFIAPQDLEYGSGMYGPQKVAKGSWVIGIRVNDKAEWQKVVAGQYVGVSVGGMALRTEIHE